MDVKIEKILPEKNVNIVYRKGVAKRLKNTNS